MQYFVTNLFRTLCSNFYQNRPSFAEDVSCDKHVGLLLYMV